MNFALNTQLDEAYKYYLYEERNFHSKIREQMKAIESFKQAFSRRTPPKTPSVQMEEQNIKDNLLCFFLWPVGLINKIKHKKNRAKLERQANEQFVAQMQAYETFCSEISYNIRYAHSLIQQLEAKRREFEKTYHKVISFIPPDYRSLRDVESLRSYVRSGRADSLKEAINLMHTDIQREYDRELQRSIFEQSQELKQRHHEQTLASLSEIQKKQDRASAERRRMQETLSGIHYELRY